MSEYYEMQKILIKAMELEKYGQNFYSLLQELVDDKKSQALFKHLAFEEENHYRMFRDALRQHNGDVQECKDFDPDQLFNKDVAPLMKKGPEAVFQYAIDVEQRVIDFYRNSLQKISNLSVRQVLIDLIKFEEFHKKNLVERLSSIRISQAGI